MSASEVDAGAALTVIVTAACPHGCDLSGLGICIRDETDAELAGAELGDAEAGAHATEAFALEAPLAVGVHSYRAVLVPLAKGQVIHTAEPAEFSFAVKAHATRMNVWGLPSAIAAGKRFSFKVGVKCSAACPQAGRTLSVVDADGREVGAATLGADIWPASTALHYAEVTAEAPPEPGAYQWEVRTPGSATGVPHLAGAVSLPITVVGAPAFEVTIETWDREQQTPIRGASVVMHPYRTQSDENGVARLRVAQGHCGIMVSGSKYLPVRTEVTVTGDVRTRADLEREPPMMNPDEAY